MKKRKLEKRIDELEASAKHEADSLTRLYARVEELERKVRRPGRWTWKDDKGSYIVPLTS